MDALICLGRHVRSDCSDEDIAMIRDSESYSYVTQYVMAVSLACYQYNDGNMVILDSAPECRTGQMPTSCIWAHCQLLQ